MSSRFGLCFVIVLAAFALAGCSIARVQSSVPMPPGKAGPVGIQPGPGTPIASNEKVVTLVPQSATQAPPASATPAASAALAATPTAATPPTSTASPTPPTFANFGETSIHYSDPVSGVGFDIPSTWEITDLTPEQKRAGAGGYTISVRSPLPPSKPKQQEGPLPEGASALDISFWKADINSYEEAVAARLKQHRESETPVTITSMKETSLGGLKATRFDLDTRNGRVVEVVTYTKSGMLLVDAWGDLKLLETILASFQIP